MSYAPTCAIVRGAHELACELLVVWRALWVCQEQAAVVIDDVVLVLAGFANSSIGDGEHVIVVHVVVPGAIVSGALKIGWREVQTTCAREYHWLSCHHKMPHETSA